ncbi:MAG TPA: hypothetical protein V6D47_04515 [Oscillatoriaceae cyanobacterium]
MPNIPLPEIVTALEQHVDAEKAMSLLGVALDQLNLDVRESYTPEEVMAIGAYIVDGQREELRESGIPEVIAFEEGIGAFVDGLKADLLEPVEADEAEAVETPEG